LKLGYVTILSVMTLFLAATLVKKGDTMGWGVIFPDDDLSDSEEQIVLCYLTINRNVILTRALIQPAGGLHATVVLPYGCIFTLLLPLFIISTVRYAVYNYSMVVFILYIV